MVEPSNTHSQEDVEKIDQILKLALDPKNYKDVVAQLSLKLDHIRLVFEKITPVLNQEVITFGAPDYKDKYLGLLAILCDELKAPFVWQLNSPVVLAGLEKCLSIPKLKASINMMLIYADEAFNFDKQKLAIPDLRKFIKQAMPSWNFSEREPNEGFETNLLRILKLHNECQLLQEKLNKSQLQEQAADKAKVKLLKKITNLKTDPKLKSDKFKPIQNEFIDELLVEISGYETSFLKSSKKVKQEYQAHMEQSTVSLSRAPQKKEEPIKQTTKEEPIKQTTKEEPIKQTTKEEPIKQATKEKPSPVKNDPKYNHDKDTPIHKRRFFYDGEILPEDESGSVEYKNYYYPFNDAIMAILQKTICAFLNQRGGRIYLGVRDEDKSVCGLNLTAKSRDYLKLDIAYLLESFYPTITHQQYVKVMFIPIIDKEASKPIGGQVIVKIIVRQGDLRELYSVSRETLKCFIRQDGYCKKLDADQVTKLIRERVQPDTSQKVDPAEFDDPVPETLTEIVYETAKKPQYADYGFKVNGIAPKTTDKEFDNLFKEFPGIIKKILFREGSNYTGDCKGYALVYFSEFEQGNLVICFPNI